MMDLGKWRYGWDGLFRRWRQSRVCPCCGMAAFSAVDRKGFHYLLRCGRCGLLYRWPYETQEEMARFYQQKYRQTGLTTDLPSEQILRELLKTRFEGSSKNFSRVIELLRILSVRPDAKILDFGANWGYGVWQLCDAGFDAVGYEISEPRADFSVNLDVRVYTQWLDVEAHAPYDVVLSSHVLEHTPNPGEALRRQRQVLKPDGLLIAYFPNGSASFRTVDAKAFHQLWGRVHPVMLDEVFIRKTLSGLPVVMGAHCAADLENLKRWDRRTSWVGDLSTSETLLVLAAPRVPAYPLRDNTSGQAA